MQAAFPAREAQVAALFADASGAHGILRAALGDMGHVLADVPRHPRCAVAWVGDFLFCGGQPGPSAAHLMRRALSAHGGSWLIDAPGPWQAALARVHDFRLVRRRAFDPGVQPEDDRLQILLQGMPVGLRFQPIEGPWIARCREAEWSRDFVSLYDDAAYARQGLGVLLLAEDSPVAGASSYVSYPGGIEVQLQTRDDMQGRGYATLAAARLLLTAHERGLTVSWDAANPASGHIAEKLGYRALGLYEMAEVILP